MSRVVNTLPKEPNPPYIDHAQGVYLFKKNGQKLLDMTAGSTSHAVLGWSHPVVLAAMREQMERICHIDYKIWSDENRDRLADLMLSRAEHGLNRVYFAGGSGSEACEAALKISYQVHHDSGKKSKSHYISRLQSYHGSTSGALSVSDRPNFDFLKPVLPQNVSKIPQHHPLYLKREDESLDDYAKRSAKELEDKILEIGPENVCAFIGETIMGGLVGDVVPAPNYWKYIRKVCDKYDVHLILDEVYCGMGASGKIYCCDWDGITPDLIFVGKALGAGYAPASAVIMSEKFEKIIANGQGRVQHGHTHQGHSLSIAASLAVQKVIHEQQMLDHICNLGHYMRHRLKEELSSHPFYRDVRGRGLRFSFEYKCENQNQFGVKFTEILEKQYGIFINGKWHRVSFTPPFIITPQEADFVLDSVIKVFKDLAKNWS